MNNDDLVVRQKLLLVRSTELRIRFSDQTQVLKAPLAVADQARNGLQWLYQNPQWPIAGVLVFLVLRPRRALMWGQRVWWIWKTYQRVRNGIGALPAALSPPKF